jgi:hypothetical protein
VPGTGSQPGGGRGDRLQFPGAPEGEVVSHVAVFPGPDIILPQKSRICQFSPVQVGHFKRLPRGQGVWVRGGPFRSMQGFSEGRLRGSEPPKGKRR